MVIVKVYNFLFFYEYFYHTFKNYIIIYKYTLLLFYGSCCESKIKRIEIDKKIIFLECHEKINWKSKGCFCGTLRTMKVYLTASKDRR